MFNGTEQQFSISTVNDKQQITTRCHLSNKLGSWVTNPNLTLKIYRDSEPLTISCDNEKQTGTASIQPNYSGGLFALDLIGTGLIGIFVDSSNKSLYEYTTPSTVTMQDAILKEK